MTNFFNTNLFSIIILVLILLVLVWNAFLEWQNFKLKKKFKVLFKGKKADDLEKTIFELIKKLEQSEKEITELKKFAQYLEKMALSSIQKVGVVRYNPFKEVGSDQSFSIALLDSQNNGFVITSLYGREVSRIYTKPIERGTSQHSLSEEEKKAIEKATGS